MELNKDEQKITLIITTADKVEEIDDAISLDLSIEEYAILEKAAKHFKMTVNEYVIELLKATTKSEDNRTVS